MAFVLELDSSNTALIPTLEYLAHFVEPSKNPLIILESSETLVDRIAKANTPLDVSDPLIQSEMVHLGPGMYRFDYKEIGMVAHLFCPTNVPTPVGMDLGVMFQILHLSLHSPGDKDSIEQKRILLDFVQSALLQSRNRSKRKERHLSCMIRNKSNWVENHQFPKRDLTTVYMPERDSLERDLGDFLAEETTYSQYGIPYKRNYLLYGPPGTGKTSLITALASHFDMGICILNFGVDLEDNEFIRLISRVPENHILVLEDIDNLFVDNRSNGKSTMISFSSLLNTLDGMCRRQRLVCFMTTNHRDRLDPTLIRAGRIDRMVEFRYADATQVAQMYRVFRGDTKNHSKADNEGIVIDCNRVQRNADEEPLFVKQCSRIQGLTTGCLQKFLFETRKESTVLDRMDRLREIIQEHGGEKGGSKGMMYN